MKNTESKAIGGIVKNSNMTSDERKAHSMKMVERKKLLSNLPVATHTGSLMLARKFLALFWRMELESLPNLTLWKQWVCTTAAGFQKMPQMTII